MPLIHFSFRERVASWLRSGMLHWTWWCSELGAMGNEAVAVFTRNSSRRARLAIGETELVLTAVNRSGVEAELGRAQRPREAAALAEAAANLVTADPAIRRLDLLLPPDVVLSRTVRLPEAARRQFRSAIEIQLPRLMPLTADQIYFDCAVSSLDAERKQIVVELAIVRRCVTDLLLGGFVAQGEVSVSVIAKRMDEGSGTYFRFAERRPRKLEKAHSLNRWLATSATILLMVAVALFIYQWRRLDQSITRQLAATDGSSATAHKLQAALEARIQRISAVANRLQAPDPAAVLSALNRALPDNAFIYQMQLDGRAVRLEGMANDASTVASMLGQSPLFRQIVLRSATKNVGADAERFDISLQLEDGTQ